MKTGFLISSLSRKAGGLHDGVRRLAQSMKAVVAGEIHVLGMMDEHTVSDVGAWSPVKTQAYPVRGPRAFGYAPQLKRAALAVDLDILQLHGLWMYPTVAALAWHRRTGRPLIVSPHGMLDEWAVKNSRWKKRIAGWCYQNAGLREAACIRALCASEAKSIRAYGLKNPVCVIPNGIDLPKADPACPPPRAKRSFSWPATWRSQSQRLSPRRRLRAAVVQRGPADGGSRSLGARPTGLDDPGVQSAGRFPGRGGHPDR